MVDEVAIKGTNKRREQLPIVPVKATKKVKKAAEKAKEELVQEAITAEQEEVIAEEVKAERLEESSEDATATTE